MPSASQKRLNANGRSCDTESTTVSSRPVARWLNARALAAQTPVSMLGWMLRIRLFPAKSPSEMSARSPPVTVKSGACDPTSGSSPLVWIGLPRKVTVAMPTTLARLQFEVPTAAQVEAHEAHGEHDGGDQRRRLILVQEVEHGVDLVVGDAGDDPPEHETH